jgi:hypothetical protein
MIAHISPASTAFEESRNTLTYAGRAKNIKTRVRPPGLPPHTGTSLQTKILASGLIRATHCTLSKASHHCTGLVPQSNVTPALSLHLQLRLSTQKP